MIISISGKNGSGKDTVGKIIQILIDFPYMSESNIIKNINKEFYNQKFVNKKWADKLKDVVCILIGCTRKQLEDRDFKEKPLGEEWWYYKYLLHGAKINFATGDFILDENGKAKRYPIISEKTNKQEWKFISKETVDEMSEEEKSYHNVELVKLTPRLLLQLIGTDCMRNIIHPNIWVNSLMSGYKLGNPLIYLDDDVFNSKHAYTHTSCENCGKPYYGYKDQLSCKSCTIKNNEINYPNWIITDTRFPNEYEAVKNEGFSILVKNDNLKVEDAHISETALDGYDFDYYLDNTKQDYSSLIKDIKLILSKEIEL